MCKKLVIGLIAVFFLYGGVVSAANLLLNPGFESPVVTPVNTNVAKTPTSWRIPTGWTTSNLYIYQWATGGAYPQPPEGLQRMGENDNFLVQDVEPIAANTVYTFSVAVMPSDVASSILGGTGKVGLRIYNGTNYIILAQSQDYHDLPLVFQQWNTITVQWDSTNYPQTWGKTLTATLLTNGLVRYQFDACSLTKAASLQKVGVTRSLPEEYIAVSENGATYDLDVQLSQSPTSDVTITIDPNTTQLDVGAGAGAAVTRTFTPANWATPQMVTVSAVNDTATEGVLFDALVFSVVSSDTAYTDPNAIPAPLVVKVLDNDGGPMFYNGSFEIPALPLENAEKRVALPGWVDLYCRNMYQFNPLSSSVIQPTDGVCRWTSASSSDMMQPIGVLIEANTGYALELDRYGATYPTTGDDKIKLACYDSGDLFYLSDMTVVAESYYLTTTASQWKRFVLAWNSRSAPQYVGKKLAVIVASATSTLYLDNISLKQTFLTIEETSGTTDVWERPSLGNTDTYTIVLDRQPTDSVTITATSSDIANVTVSPATLTFTTSNWQTPQTVTVMAVDDATNEGVTPKVYSISHAVVSSDPIFNGAYGRPLDVTVRDDDTADLAFTNIAGLAVSEAGPTSATYDVALMIAPTSDITVVVAAGGDVTAAPATLTFTSANWATPQTVTVTAVDDSLRETNPEIAIIAHTVRTLDTVWAVVPTRNVSVSVTENDFCGNVGYYPGDINQDCTVNITDLQTFVLSWLNCSDLTDPLCTQP